MTLIVCKDCKKEFSNDAKRCPHCGAKKPPNMALRYLLLVLFLIYTVKQCQDDQLASDRHQPVPSSTNATPAPPQASLPPHAAPEAAWEVNEVKSPMDDSKGVVLSKGAKFPIQVWLKQANPTLIIRCKENKTGVLVITGSAAQPELGKYEKYTVEIRIDEGKPYRELWVSSTDNDSLFAPNPVAIAKKLASAHKVLIRFTPFNAPPATIEFGLDGLDSLLPQVAGACGWK